MRTERRVSYEADDDIKIHDLNDWDSGMKQEPRSGQTDGIPKNGRQGAEDAGRGRYRKEKRKAGKRRTPESRITMKNRRRKKRRTVFSVCVFLLALTALAGCFVLAMENRKLHDEVQVAMAYVDEVNSITTYTEEEVRKMTADAAAEAAEKSSLEKDDRQHPEFESGCD